MSVTLETISYEKLKEGLTFDNDKYSVLSYQYKTRREALLANPFLDDYSMDYMLIGTADGIIIGRDTRFPIKFKVDDNILDAFSGTSFFVMEEYRKDPIGAEMFLYKLRNKSYVVSIASGLSDMAIPFHKKTKRTVFFFPKFWQIRRSRSFFQKLGIKGPLLSIFTFLFDIPIKIFKSWQLNGTTKMIKDYSVEKVSIVPRWVEDVVMNDGHKYMELHDQKWLQWNLDYNFCGGKDNYQSFYVIYHAGHPVGFFMLKHRFYDNKWRMRNVKIASVVEWGVSQGEKLTELDIIKLASKALPNDIDILELATTDKKLAQRFKHKLFLNRGEANVSVHDIKKQYSDIKQMDLWRLRLGYADVIMAT